MATMSGRIRSSRSARVRRPSVRRMEFPGSTRGGSSVSSAREIDLAWMPALRMAWMVCGSKDASTTGPPPCL